MGSTDNTPGYVGNLSAEQEGKLRQLWSIVIGLNNLIPDNFQDVTLEDKNKEDQAQQQQVKRQNSSLSNGTSSNWPPGLNQALLDLGIQNTELKSVRDNLERASVNEIRRGLLSTVKQDHPDALLLRFIRARKWDVSKAFNMMLGALLWRLQEQHVDDHVVANSELQALKESQNKSDPALAKAGTTFLAQMRMGKSYVHSTDRVGRPIGYVKARLHNPKEQSEEVMKRYILHVIETTRLVLDPPAETSTVLFDMTGFSISNMEYAPVKFLIDCFQANYPESLGTMLIHNAPWVFWGIWKVVKSWMDPVIVAKVDFTYTAADLHKHIAPEHLVKELGGEDPYEFKFIEPVEGENEKMADTTTRDALFVEREKMYDALLKDTEEWIQAAKENDTEKVAAIKQRRDEGIEILRLNYWKLDPHVRGRCHLDREGVLGNGGKIRYYPSKSES